jgi:hypothetical protein
MHACSNVFLLLGSLAPMVQPLRAIPAGLGVLMLCMPLVAAFPWLPARGGWQSLATIFQHYLSFEVLPSKEAFLLLGFLLAPPVYAAGKMAYGL